MLGIPSGWCPALDGYLEVVGDGWGVGEMVCRGSNGSNGVTGITGGDRKEKARKALFSSPGFKATRQHAPAAA